MKHHLIILGLVLAGCTQLWAGGKKAVVIIVDGIPKDAIERLHVPAIFDIARTGSFGKSYVGGETGTYNETPTISAVGYNTMLTGTWANKHNVFGNSNLSPNYHYWSLFRIAKEQKQPLTTAIFSSWTDNRTVLLGEGKPETGNLKIDYVYDGYDLDSRRFPKKEKDMHVFDYDEEVSANAEKCIRENGPDLSWVYLWYTDDASHMYGDGAYFDEYILKAGEQIGRIWQAVQYRQKQFGEEWMILVTTDHGRTFDGHGHGRQSERERTTWIATNRKLNTYFKEGKAGMVDINPTLCDFLGMEVPTAVRWEQDGISLLGKTEICNLRLAAYDQDIILRWNAVKKSAPVSIYAAPANEYKTTGKENWIHLADVKAGQQEYRCNRNTIGKGPFYKFVVVSGHESLNRWFSN